MTQPITPDERKHLNTLASSDPILAAALARLEELEPAGDVAVVAGIMRDRERRRLARPAPVQVREMSADAASEAADALAGAVVGAVVGAADAHGDARSEKVSSP